MCLFSLCSPPFSLFFSVSTWTSLYHFVLKSARRGSAYLFLSVSARLALSLLRFLLSGLVPFPSPVATHHHDAITVVPALGSLSAHHCPTLAFHSLYVRSSVFAIALVKKQSEKETRESEDREAKWQYETH